MTCGRLLVSSTKKADHHNIAEILLKVALNKFFITLTHNFVKFPSDKKSTYEKDKDNEEDVSDEEQTPTNTGDEDKEAEDVHNTVTKSQDIIGISKTHGISHLSQAASIVIGGNGTGSLTKLDSDSVGTTPSFKTRKR